jgi:hypothetical protein
MPADGFAHQFVDIGKIELFLDPRGVALDGFETNVQMFGNLPRTMPAPSN